MEQLEILLSMRSHYSAPLLGIDPAWDPLRDHPGFQALMEEYAERVE